MTPDQIDELGTALARCCQHGIVSPLRLDRIISAEDTEAVQAAAVEAYGGTQRGYSIQGTTALSQRLLCCHEPFFGPILEDDLGPNGTTFRLPYGVLGAGCALTFVMGLPYPMDDVEISRETASRAVAGCWLARLLKARSQELDAGDIVSTGTCTGLLQVVPGQTFKAEFGGLGSVTVSFE